jgi:ketosteroid isomerase-like protein
LTSGRSQEDKVREIVLFSILILLSVARLKAATPADDVRDALLTEAHAVEQKDMATIERLWAHDDGVTVFENGHGNYGWADYRDHHLKPEIEHMANVHYQLSEIVPHVIDTTAWVTFKYSMTADVTDRHIDSNGVGTAVLEKHGDRWQIVHWHSSAARPRPSAPVPAKP